ncbi:sugar isomerase domain-containing protein [Egibacter rhizosphaerae]|uniref:sugar isomerase domain-containing protein n=1 Tax=Egibacter rhizosphaerae TaxID=1670831 RepID=UPI0013F1747C|nr:sugar isomerase domain-containing protein [Egibacter rhizosphaerae]
MAAGAGAFGAYLREHLEAIEERNAVTLDRLADALLATVRNGGLVHVGGTGHSTGLLLETFYRAGGLACVQPLYDQGLSPLEGAVASTARERTSGLAERILRQAAPDTGDLGIVFSNSGTNPVPVELAQGLSRRGCTVAAVCSLEHLRQAPRRSDAKLDEIADLVLDTGAPEGDVAYAAGPHHTAPVSSLAGVYLWSLALARLADRAAAAGIDLPLWQSTNVADGEARNEATIAAFGPRIPRLSVSGPDGEE